MDKTKKNKMYKGLKRKTFFMCVLPREETFLSQIQFNNTFSFNKILFIGFSFIRYAPHFCFGLSNKMMV